MDDVPVHGGVSSQPGVSRRDVLDLSANLNSLGPPEEILEAAKAGVEESDAYPEPASRSLRETYAEEFGLSPREILFGRGSTELIFLISMLFSGERVGVESPGFGEYGRAVESAGGEVVDVEVGPDPSVEDYEGVAGDVEACFVCTPHNPSGRSLEGLTELVEGFPNTTFVVDRAFTDFEPPGKHPDIRGFGNVVELFSLTKSFAIPGLRAGYLTAPSNVVEELLSLKQPWTLGQPSVRAAEACLGLEGFLDESRGFVESEREFLRSGLEEFFEVGPSDANFLLVEVGDASGFKGSLLGEGVLVRDCSSFGLPGHVRVAVGTREENEAVIDAVRRVAP